MARSSSCLIEKEESESESSWEAGCGAGAAGGRGARTNASGACGCAGGETMRASCCCGASCRGVASACGQLPNGLGVGADWTACTGAGVSAMACSIVKGEVAGVCWGAVSKGLAFDACIGASKPKPCGSDTRKGESSGLRRSGMREVLRSSVACSSWTIAKGELCQGAAGDAGGATEKGLAAPFGAVGDAFSWAIVKGEVA